MFSEAEPKENKRRKLGSCLGWLTLLGVPGVVLTLAVVFPLIDKYYEQKEMRQSHDLMQEQMERLKRGEINCLVNPDARFIDELLADADCAAHIRDLYLGGDISDARLGRLRELPNLKSIVFLFAKNPDVFLERLRGHAAIEQLSFVNTWLSPKGLESIGTFAKLKSLSLPIGNLGPDDLHGIRNNPSIAELFFTASKWDMGLASSLQSLPRLHSVTIETDSEETQAKHDQYLLRQALPNCKCRVTTSGK